MNRPSTLRALPVLAFLAFLAGCASSPPSAAPSRDEGLLYTEAQAARGSESFEAVCVVCHYANEFHGAAFQAAWGSRSVGDLFELIVTRMPDDDPGSLEPPLVADVVAYILRLNGFEAGGRELPADAEALRGHLLRGPGGGAP